MTTDDGTWEVEMSTSPRGEQSYRVRRRRSSDGTEQSFDEWSVDTLAEVHSLIGDGFDGIAAASPARDSGDDRRR